MQSRTRLVATLAILAVILLVVWQWLTFPDIASLRSKAPETTAFMEHRKRILASEGKKGSVDYRWVSYERISPNLRHAVVVSEDSRFWEHEGVDAAELRNAVKESFEEQRLTRGGSTITQQLAKNLYLSPSRNPWRKVKELLISLRMEKVLGKKRILEIYLNVAEFGERVYGAEAAAQHYFGKPASQLTREEAALLAGCLPNPRRMNPANPSRTLKKRQRIILSRMERWEYLRR